MNAWTVACSYRSNGRMHLQPARIIPSNFVWLVQKTFNWRFSINLEHSCELVVKILYPCLNVLIRFHEGRPVFDLPRNHDQGAHFSAVCHPANVPYHPVCMTSIQFFVHLVFTIHSDIVCEEVCLFFRLCCFCHYSYSPCRLQKLRIHFVQRVQEGT